MKPFDAAENIPHIPGLADGEAEPYFHAPWQAKLFALTLSLRDHGLFGWPDWTERFARRLKMATELPSEASTPEHAAHYYMIWMQTLEEILEEAGAVDIVHIGETAKNWQRAAHATPHGQPILYENGLTSP